MNRALIFGIAIFFAVVGIALLGADNSAVAGHGCHGCNGCHGGGNGCHGCHGGGLFGRMFNGCHGCHGCHGYNDCCGQPAPPVDCCQPVDCCGNGGYGGAVHSNGYHNGGAYGPPAGEVPGAPTPAVEGPNGGGGPPPAPAPSASKRAPRSFRQVSFRR